jgi:hypothetical protein
VKRYLLALALVPSVAGCDLGFNLTGLGDSFACTDCWDVGGGGGSGRSSRYYSGQISIGPYSVVEGEATVYAYDPSDLTVPIDSAVSHDQGCFRLVTNSCVPGYTFDFGSEPAPVICGYLARVVLWNGDSSELAPLFPTAPTPCDSLSTPGGARDYSLPAYSPLNTPFALEGSVVIDGRPGDAVRVDILTRPTPTDSASTCDAWSFFSVRRDESVLPPRATCVHVYTDPSGRFLYSTTDPAQLLVLCGLAIARVSLPDDRTLQRQLESTTRDTCTHRRFHDFRFGGQEAAGGAVRLLDAERWAEAGEVYVEVLDPSHSSTIGEPGWTLDDGSFFLWLPDEMVEPPCDLVLRATVAGGGSKIQPRSPGATATSCSGGYLNLFELAGANP